MPSTVPALSTGSQWQCEYITFVRMPHEGKTTKWGVVNRRHGDVLGGILWYGEWRQYVFEAVDGCVFSVGCLRDIAAFICDLTAERKPK